MGQSVAALMYGVRKSKLPKNILDKDSGEFIWDTMPQEKRLDRDKLPRDAYEGDVLGFKVAASSSPDRDEGDLGETARVGDLAEVHAAFVKVAKKKWTEFALWLLKEHRLKLPPADLWITTDERA